ncbi:hypothetical protein D3C87_1391060 [compost metagenome]
MAAGIVDELEPIQIDDTDQYVLFLPLRQGEQACGIVQNGTPVGQAGEGIGQGQFGQLGVGSLESLNEQSTFKGIAQQP